MLKTFRHGTHPKESKLTKDLPLKDFPVPQNIYISLSQHIGAAAKAVVAVGDAVKVGTLIGEAQGNVSANIFSSVSGKVKAFVTLPTAIGVDAQHIEIENDFRYEEINLPKVTSLTKENILSRIKEAGIVGMGGATFPTHVKLNPTKKVDTLVINGAECEPYITCDYRLMLENAKEIVEGTKLLMIALGVDKAIIGVESNKMDAAENLKKLCPENIEVVVLKTKYPQGAEKQLIYSLTRRTVPACGLPMDVGVVVNNIHTAYSVFKAIEGEPLYKRAMTVSGDGVENKGNFWVRNGVPFKFIYDECRGNIEEAVTKKVINGGPMMGIALPNLNSVTAKGTSALLFLSEKSINTMKASQCINCSRCVSSCPMNLLPNAIEEAAQFSDFEKAAALNASSCIECGSCSFVCPAKRPILQEIRLAKKVMKERGLK